MKKKTEAMSANSKAAIGVGAGIAALAAAAAGAYYLYGSDEASKNRRAVKSWMLRAKAEVMDEIERMKDVSEPAYREAVRRVMKKYQEIKGMDSDEIAVLAARMQAHWKDIKREIEGAGTSKKPHPKAKKK